MSVKQRHFGVSVAEIQMFILSKANCDELYVGVGVGGGALDTQELPGTITEVLVFSHWT